MESGHAVALRRKRMRLGEWWTARLIASWRGDVRRSVATLVECAGPAEALRLRGEVEKAAMLRAGLLRRGDHIGRRAFGYPARWLNRLALA